jgi:hypothetical protein
VQRRQRHCEERWSNQVKVGVKANPDKSFGQDAKGMVNGLDRHNWSNKIQRIEYGVV